MINRSHVQTWLHGRKLEKHRPGRAWMLYSLAWQQLHNTTKSDLGVTLGTSQEEMLTTSRDRGQDTHSLAYLRYVVRMFR